MEDAVVKQGEIYLQLQQTFGKKWKKFWAVLYRESSCSSARLELQEGSAERPRRAEGCRRLVRLSDCVHVGEASGESPGSPRDTVPFVLDTTERRLLLAAEGGEAREWIRRLCELAFPRSREEAGAAKEGAEGEFSMEENSLYSSRGRAVPEQEFEVTVRVTPSSQRCRLRGRCVLRAGPEALELLHPQSQELLSSWPYRFLRRFGRDKATFSFEAGRRCASGEGNFEFDTRQGNEIFQAIEAAIDVQRGRGAREPRWGGSADEAPRLHGHEEPKGHSGEGKVPKGEGKGVKGRAGTPPGAGEPSGPSQARRGVDFPYAEPRDSLRRGKAPDKGHRQDGAGLESEYAVPFDTIAKSFLARQLGALGCPQEGAGQFGGLGCPQEGPRQFGCLGCPQEGPRQLGGLGCPPEGPRQFGTLGCPQEGPRKLNTLGCPPEGVPEPPSSTREAERAPQPPGRPTAPKPEHIYDEPEALCALSVYDEPEEVKGDAWRLQAAPEEPPGRGCPYDPQRDDYAVPKRQLPLRQPFVLQGKEWLGRCEYDNVALRGARRRDPQ